MPAWPGGPCPVCGEDMPERMVHCRNCRAMLNTDLESDSIEIPAFVPLQEIASYISLPIRGYFIPCPSCQRELRINEKYAGKKVSCKHCESTFRFDPNAQVKGEPLQVYVYCPHCDERLRVARRYLGAKVACKSCKGELVIEDPSEAKE